MLSFAASHLSFPSPRSRNSRRPDAGDGEREDRGFHYRPQPLGLRSRRHREDHVLLQRGEPETHSLNIHAFTSAITEIVLSLREEINFDSLIYYCRVRTLMSSGFDGLFAVLMCLQCMYCVQTYVGIPQRIARALLVLMGILKKKNRKTDMLQNDLLKQLTFQI